MQIVIMFTTFFCRQKPIRISPNNSSLSLTTSGEFINAPSPLFYSFTTDFNGSPKIYLFNDHEEVLGIKRKLLFWRKKAKKGTKWAFIPQQNDTMIIFNNDGRCLKKFKNKIGIQWCPTKEEDLDENFKFEVEMMFDAEDERKAQELKNSKKDKCDRKSSEESGYESGNSKSGGSKSGGKIGNKTSNTSKTGNKRTNKTTNKRSNKRSSEDTSGTDSTQGDIGRKGTSKKSSDRNINDRNTDNRNRRTSDRRTSDRNRKTTDRNDRNTDNRNRNTNNDRNTDETRDSRNRNENKTDKNFIDTKNATFTGKINGNVKPKGGQPSSLEGTVTADLKTVGQTNQMSGQNQTGLNQTSLNQTGLNQTDGQTNQLTNNQLTNNQSNMNQTNTNQSNTNQTSNLSNNLSNTNQSNVNQTSNLSNTNQSNNLSNTNQSNVNQTSNLSNLNQTGSQSGLSASGGNQVTNSNQITGSGGQNTSKGLNQSNNQINNQSNNQQNKTNTALNNSLVDNQGGSTTGNAQTDQVSGQTAKIPPTTNIPSAQNCPESNFLKNLKPDMVIDIKDANCSDGCKSINFDCVRDLLLKERKKTEKSGSNLQCLEDLMKGLSNMKLAQQNPCRVENSVKFNPGNKNMSRKNNRFGDFSDSGSSDSYSSESSCDD